MSNFISKAEKTTTHDTLSISMTRGEKTDLIEALNKAEHPYRSLSQFFRAAINKELKSMKIKFQLSE